MPLKWLCHSDKKKKQLEASSRTHDTGDAAATHDKDKDTTRCKKQEAPKHMGQTLRTTEEWMAERWRRWAVDGAVQIKIRAERRVRESYLIYFRTRDIKNIWPTDGAQWRNFPCWFPPKPRLSRQTGESMNISPCLGWKGLVLGDELTLGWQDCGGDAAYLMTITIGTCV